MSPVATSLDKLHGDESSDSFFGYVLPTLYTVKYRLDSCLKKHYLSFINALQAGFKSRFDDLLTIDNIFTNTNKQKIVLAAVSHPHAKLRWLTTFANKKLPEELFFAECHKLHAVDSELPANNAVNSDNDFYGFDSITMEKSGNDSKFIGVPYFSDSSFDICHLKHLL